MIVALTDSPFFTLSDKPNVCLALGYAAGVILTTGVFLLSKIPPFKAKPSNQMYQVCVLDPARGKHVPIEGEGWDYTFDTERDANRVLKQMRHNDRNAHYCIMPLGTEVKEAHTE